MSALANAGRNLRALRHYRLRQVGHRAIIRLRRRANAVFPGYWRRRLGKLADVSPPIGETRCPPALRAFALSPAVTPPERLDELLGGVFTFLGETHQYAAQPDWRQSGPHRPSHLWRMNLHYHRFLVDAAAGGLREPDRASAAFSRASALLHDWRRSCEFGPLWTWEAAWHPYSASTRLLNAWLARRLIAGVAGDAAEELRRGLDIVGATHAALIAGWLEWDLEGNHLLRNACALLAAGQWFAGEVAADWSRLAVRILSCQLSTQLLGDGFHEERSPMYHALLLEDLLLALPGDARALLEAEPGIRVADILRALPPVLHHDGEIALFNDAAFGIAAPAQELVSLAEACGIPGGSTVGELPTAGYFRFQLERDVLIADTGPLGPDHLPAHAHCDALSFEYSVDGQRLVVDTGVDRYEAGPERQHQRSTAAHSTLQVGDREQAECFGSFRMGRRPRVRGRRVNATSITGSHDGFGRDAIHHRTFEWRGQQGFGWSDRIEGSAEVPVTVRVTLAPGVDTALGEHEAQLSHPTTGRFRLNAPLHGALFVAYDDYCPRFGERHRRAVVCWHGIARSGDPLEFALIRDG